MYNFAKRLKEIRERMGLSQKTLGMMLGLSDKAISSYESGRTLPPLDTLQKISEELNIPLTELLFSNDKDFSITTKLNEIERMIQDINKVLEEIKAELSQADSRPPTQPTVV